MRALRLAAVVGAVGVLLSCSNAGQDRVLAIPGTGIVRGVTYFDRNGNFVPDFGGADTAFSGIRVQLLAQGTSDTVAKGVSDATGQFRFEGVPVGHYTLSVDTTAIAGDTVRVTRIDTAVVNLEPNDSPFVKIAISYPHLAVRQARLAPLGHRVFVVGIALSGGFFNAGSQSFGIFGDTTLYLADTSQAIRETNVRSGVFVSAPGGGDSLRLLGTRSNRDGQPTIDNVTVFVLLAGASQPPVRTLTTVVAATANADSADAALVKVQNALIQDTATVAGNRRLTVDDGSGALEVRLDTIVGFKAAQLASDTVGGKIDAVGILVPVSAGVWRLKPRSTGD